ncbi:MULTISPECIES: dihydrofolate reductase [Halomicrobium]|uniref:dihydrofolate reductase n=2 Tax=Halomicrobium mukohataei TaxID=57705 RepID=C7P1M2_HALMD|nr:MULTISPECIES: dihydrofolate reductase [Halomicrobium]ACV49112.1 Dihydrofolate reductase [Halomicrobium mukohataei DSM 12286]QCD64526.1 dihydrofolate reductase [Halomicrobium mukohataei]QFR19332.1 dihydrofolate reductase [Halomicrobium sp. ZPS1]
MAAEGTDAETDIEIVLVAAVAENGVIGTDGELPWHYSEDLAHFKETTMGHPVVMGRRTFEGIVADLGEPLPGRTNVVLTSQRRDFPDGAVGAGSLTAAVGAARETGSETAYVVGGATVYEQFLPDADRLVLTEVHDQYEGDTYFPEVAWDDWREASRDDRGELSFVEYVRRE